MSSRWFRFYADAMRNPKVARLSDKQFRLWVELLAVASENDGALPCLDDLRFMLNRRLDHLSTGVEQLISMGLIDRLGDGYEPHNWGKFQYKSDTSSERVAKHRAKRNVTVTPPDTEADTETDLSIKIDKSTHVFSGRTIKLNQGDFDEWRERYHGLADIRAQLGSLDDWISSQPEAQRKKWFNIVSGALNKRHQAALAGERDEIIMPYA
jgi:hypothetical protein